MLKISENEIKELIETINDMKNNIKFCASCFKTVQGKGLCEICQNQARDKSLLCVVEKEQDLEALENTGKYLGLYFILGGNVSKLRPKDIEELRINELKDRLKNKNVEEVILALNPTTEGESTCLYLERELKPFNQKVTRLGRGLPLGGEMEYADEETLSSALEGRK
ncbi:MAG: recombination protein RecR [Candidatus Nealsonbacteria bacterium]|nr:recombination protein RecR [Candidatus Nealsonbacteria bacterium]